MRNPKGLVYIAADERRSDAIGGLLARLDASADALVFPPWDCLPFDRASPSRLSMGRRMAVLQRLREEGGRNRIVITTVEAVLQRTPPQAILQDVRFSIDADESIDLEALRAFATRSGYRSNERVEEPGDIEFHGKVVEVFPPDAPQPFRIEVADDRVVALHIFDPVTQRSTAVATHVRLGPACELLPLPPAADGDASSGLSHRLAGFYDTPLGTLFDLVPGATLVLAPGTDERRRLFVENLEEAHAAHSGLGGPANSTSTRLLPAWQMLYADEEAWQAIRARLAEKPLVSQGFEPVPNFSAERKPVHAFQAYAEQASQGGTRVVLAGVSRDLKAFGRYLERHGGSAPIPVVDWDAILQSAPGTLSCLDLDLEEGVIDRTGGVALVSAADILGTRAHHVSEQRGAAHALLALPAMKVGDTVIHEDHGVGVLEALEQVEIGGEQRDALRLRYHGDASLLAPVEDLDRVWRYGSGEDTVALDRLHTDAWSKRRIEIERSVLDTARHLVTLASERLSCAAPKLVAPAKDYARFVARFAFPETADQSAAIAAVLEEMASGQPMDRLVCGDVGFGKTEVALRAAAVALMAGKQVALVAPTTVLARQHLATFRKRFKGFGFEITGLSRLEANAEAKRVRAGLADGSIRMVIGTHAVAGSAVAFTDLGLVIIDEEQKFGAKLKSDLRAMAAQGHVLTLTATPIPRTLQAALVGVQTVSVIATPPVRRRPIRTFVAPFDSAAVRVALLRERARDGQSFVIVPRIESIDAMQRTLRGIVPELTVIVAHGDLPAEEADGALVAFGAGEGDILLATNIVESGLDVPRANTMLVCQPERFGLSQLHQLRGRVGRGRAQAVAYLLTEPEADVGDATEARLSTLANLDRLGSGFAISARDLDLRGAGDLVGDEQAGHLRLIGIELYQSLLTRAVRKAKGDVVDDDAPPELKLDSRGRIPEDYVIEADLRIELYARLARLNSAKAIDVFEHEVHDRFGEPPAAVEALFAQARLRCACRDLHVASLSAGPRGVALILHPKGLEHCKQLAESDPAFELKGAKFIWTVPESEAGDALARAEQLIERAEAGIRSVAA